MTGMVANAFGVVLHTMDQAAIIRRIVYINMAMVVAAFGAALVTTGRVVIIVHQNHMNIKVASLDAIVPRIKPHHEPSFHTISTTPPKKLFPHGQVS